MSAKNISIGRRFELLNVWIEGGYEAGWGLSFGIWDWCFGWDRVEVVFDGVTGMTEAHLYMSLLFWFLEGRFWRFPMYVGVLKGCMKVTAFTSLHFHVSQWCGQEIQLLIEVHTELTYCTSIATVLCL